jgi:hypothetical protein
MHTPHEVNTGDQFVDAPSQLLPQRRFALEPHQIVSSTLPAAIAAVGAWHSGVSSLRAIATGSYPIQGADVFADNS